MSPMRTWFITGVSTGLGKALATEVLARGDSVVGTVRGEAARAAFAALAPGRSKAVILDVTDDKRVRQVVADAERDTGEGRRSRQQCGLWSGRRRGRSEPR